MAWRLRILAEFSSWDTHGGSPPLIIPVPGSDAPFTHMQEMPIYLCKHTHIQTHSQTITNKKHEKIRIV